MRIFEFTNYQVFLRSFIDQQPRKGRGVIKSIAEYINVDPSQVSQILSGKKDFTEEQAILICKYLGQNEIESDFFLTLVKINRAGSKTLRDHYLQKLKKLKEASLDLKERISQDRILSDYEKSVFYSSYIYSAIRLSTSINDGLTLNEIIKKFQISRERANEILQFLMTTNLIQESNGRFILGTQHTHIERGSPFLPRHHHNWRIKALEKTERSIDQELQFTGPVSISKKDFDSVRELLLEAISKSLDKVKKSEADDVACLLIDWFWIQK